MPDDTRCANGSVVGDLLSVATLLKNPHLTGLYAYLYRDSLSVISATMDMARRYIAAADDRSEHDIEQTDAEVGGATAMLLERGDRSPSTRMIYQRFEGSNGR